MGTNYIAPIWRMPRNANKDKLSNYSIGFDNTNANYIQTNASWITDLGLNGANRLSVSIWLKPSSSAPTTAMSATSSSYGNWGENFNIRYDAGNTSLYFVGGSYASTKFSNNSVTLTTDQWHHVVFVFTSTGTAAARARCWINNSEVANQSTNLWITFADLGKSLFIGRRFYGNGTSLNQWVGEISQFCIFDYSLTDGTNGTPNQIEYLYNLNNPMAITGAAPVAYLPLGDNSNPNATAGYPNISVGADSVFNFVPNDKIDATIPALNNAVALTFSGWVKKTSGNVIGFESFVSGTDRAILYWWSDNNVYWSVRNGSSSTAASSALSNFDWNHIAGTFDGSTNTIKLYINGSLVDTETGQPSSTSGNLASNFHIGLSNGSAYNTGQISNVQVWATVLSSSEVETLYNNGQPLMTGTQPQAANLKAWYKLNQSANWEADTVGDWQIPDNRSAYPQSFKFVSADGNRVLVAPVDAGTGPINSINGAMTVSIWVKTTQGTVYEYAINRDYFGGLNRDWNLRKDNFYGGGGRMIFSVFNTSNASLEVRLMGSTDPQGNPLITMNDGKWHHIVGIYNGTDTVELYTDGVLQGSATSSGFGTLKTSARTVIGGYNNSSNPLAGGGSWNGKLSNAQIWDTNLNATQVETLYNNGAPLITAIANNNLKGWWKLDNTELFDGTNWSIQNQKYPANWESSFNSGVATGMLRDNNSKSEFDNQLFSMSVWVKPKSGIAPAGDIFACKGSSWQGVALQYIGNDLMFQIGDKNTTAINSQSGNWSFFNNRVIGASPTYTPYDQWSHIVVVWNGTNSKFYINGDLVSTITPPSALTIDYSQTNTISAIGGRNDSGGSYFTGNISNFAYWESELDQTAVTALYNNGTPEVAISQSPNHWLTLKDVATGTTDKIGNLNYLQSGSVEFIDNFVGTEAATSSGMTEQNLVNNNVSALNGESVSMDTTNLVTSDLTRKKPYSNYSFNFDSAQSDYFDCGTSLFTGSTISTLNISCWIKTTSSAAQAIISKDQANSASHGGTAAKNRNFLLQLSGGNLFWQISPSTSGTTLSGLNTSGVTFVDGNWHHILVTYEAGSTSGTAERKIYVDGQLKVTDAAATLNNIYNNTSVPIEIGRRGDGARYFEGEISNICIFDRVISQQEVLKIYNNGVTQDLQATSSFSNNISAWWPMDEHSSYYDGTDWVIRDVENGNDGDGANTGNVDDLVGNAPGSNANGTGTNLTITDLKGNMSDSDKNAYSINMADYADGVTNPANSGRSTDIP